MVSISETAGQELNAVLQADQHKGKSLYVSFNGYGWSGPILGLALDEPNDSMNSYESQGIQVYMHPGLVEQLEPLGGVVIDFVDNGPQQRGFMISTKDKPAGSCSSEGCGSEGCGGEDH